MRKQRYFPLLLALLLALISFHAAAAQSTTTLVVWDSFSSDIDQAMMTQLNDDFQSAHPGMTIQREGHSRDDLDTRLADAFAQSAAPDIAMIDQGVTHMGALVKADLILPLDAYASQFGWLNRSNSGLYVRSRVSDDGSQLGSGKLYGMSITDEAVGLFYNRDVFSKLDIEIPTDWDALQADLDIFKGNGIIPVTFGAKDADACIDTSGALIHAYSDLTDITNLIDHVAGASFLTEGDLDGVQTFVDWIDGGYFSPGFAHMDNAAAFAEFTSGKSAMWLARSTNSATIIAAMGDDHAGFFLLPSPIGDAVTPTVSGLGPAYVIRKTSANADLAAQYIDFMTNATTANILLDSGSLPATAVDAAKLKANTLSADLVNAWNTINAADKVGFPLDWALPNIANEIQRLAAKQIEPEQFVDDLDKQYQAGG